MDRRADPALAELAAAAGFSTSYEDCWGAVREVPEAALRDLLGAVAPARDDAAALPPVIVLRDRQPRGIELAAAHDVELLLEDGRSVALGRQRAFDIPADVPHGYHRLRLGGTPASECALILCPDTCWLPPAVRDGARAWGVTVQLYALKSQRNWGIGDFGDLLRLVETVGAGGGAFVGLNPLHTLNLQFPQHASPYSPSSRRWLHVLYIDVAALMDDTPPDAALAARLQALREAPLIDHAGVAEVKLAALRGLFERDAPGAAFEDFRHRHGEALHRHALYEALQAHLHARDPSVWGWPAWPAELQDVQGEAARRFAQEHPRELAFHAWLQWVADGQLQACADRCATLGMPIGLYRDLAVGASAGGADTWAEPAVHALALRVGAPPDQLSPAGQDWGLPPLEPQALRAAAYRPFVETLRANMRGAGALRIDHVMVLMRLFWIHPAHGAPGGAYRHYPHEELMALVALESERARCLVIGEDLGTVPAAMREAMREHGLLSYCPLYFERDAEGDFKAPPEWPRDALAVVSTHDLPTLAGWWRGEDIRVREALGLYAQRRQRDADRVQRTADRLRLELALEREGLDAAEDFVGAVHAWLARTPARLLAVQLEDVLEQVDAVNVPGTVHEQPNWRRRLPVAVEALDRDPRWQSLAAVLQRERPPPPPALPPLDGAEVPLATYRLQLHREFDFAAAARQVPRLAALGISHLYLSPILKARPGSRHGYDGVDPDVVNPELGGQAGFEALTRTLAGHGMKLLLDIVPNHQAVQEADNPWWLDVLAHGRASPYAQHYDIDWSAGKLLLPVLGAPYGEVLARGELTLVEAHGRREVRYFDHRFPIDPATFDGVPADAAALDALIQRQHWRLAHWRLAGHEINYRRFFDVNALAALRVERPQVFEATHRRIFEWLRHGRVAGLRIDHPDGLADPLGYFRRLQQRHAAMTGRAAYLVIEKILADDEHWPATWPVHGDTGYRWANDALAVLVDGAAEARFDRLLADFTGATADFDAVVLEAKRRIADDALAADRERLTTMAHALAAPDLVARDFGRRHLGEAISALACGHTVYRSYLDAGPADEIDRARLQEASVHARRHSAPSLAPCIDWLHRLLLERRDPEALRFIVRFQQFSAPIMAKAVEDTAFYRWHRLVCLNDVGADPRRFGIPPAEFHRRNAQRAERMPHTLLAGSTHDSKRSEDVRARLAVLSELPEAWAAFAMQWREDGAAAPSPADQYLLLQTLVGVWSPEVPLDALRERVHAYMLKAVREAKQRTSWTEPDALYEKAVAAMVERRLAPGSAFLEALAAFTAPVARYGRFNSLALLACRLTAPGVPDLYQGGEGWDHSLVDPDNRRAVDFERLQREGEAAPAPAGWREDPAIKQRLVRAVLQRRRRAPALFRDGTYLPLAGGEHVVAYARQHGDDWSLTLAGRLLWRASGGDEAALFDGGACWDGVHVALPEGAPARWRDVLTGREVDVAPAGLAVGEALRELTVAVLEPC